MVTILMPVAGLQAQQVQDAAVHPASLAVQQPTVFFASNNNTAIAGNTNRQEKSYNYNILQQRFQKFSSLKVNEIYQLTIAADVPDNKRPGKVFYKGEPGHVFVILEQKDTLLNTTVAEVWGFYPETPIMSLFIRTVKCKVLSNGGRTYDAAITIPLMPQQFEAVKQKAADLTAKKYNLNRYNCYDYAIELFNSVEGVADIPIKKVRFPLVFGKGGSPCGLYKQLTLLLQTTNNLASAVRMGNTVAPANPQ
jgi:hypothetical protein